jgi:alkanesulfonate monooxygenase SsuD/methylene tetrahydromethanopterin reductase-like flavin-dependent oxidoreductase (luciferase family)
MIFEAQIADPSRASEQQVLHECVEQAVFAEQMGFDRIWAVEHHALGQYAHMSAPEIFLSYVAAKTERIRIGHGVVCVPFAYNHPARVAEKAATLDILSRGRLDLGVGRGATPRELSIFGLTSDQTQAQLEETLKMLPGIWTSEDFSYASELISIQPPTNIIPKPVQTPHPPLFMACSKENTLKYAAKVGVGALALGFAGPDNIAEKIKTYRTAVAEREANGNTEVVGHFINDHFSALCPAIVLDDGDEARRIGFRGQRFFSESLNQWSRGTPPPDPAHYGDDVIAIDKRREDLLLKFGSEFVTISDPVARRDAEHASGMHMTTQDQAYGTVDDCANYVQRLVDGGADEIMFLIQMGTVSQDVCMETIEKIGKQVLPQFRGAETSVRVQGANVA